MKQEPFITLVMAAGKGKRMLDPDLPKVMYRVNGTPMVDHVVDLAFEIGSRRIVVIVGFKRELVVDHLTDKYGKSIEFAVQAEQLGTGHAVMQTEPVVGKFEGDLLVLSGDVPILRASTLSELLRIHSETDSSMTVVTAETDEPTGYGRIVRHKNGTVDKIVEERDASPDEKAIREINSGIYCFKAGDLFEALKHVSPNNAQHEYYLTDVFGYFTRHRKRVSAVLARDFDEIRGINTRAQLEVVESILNGRYAKRPEGRS